MYSSKETQSTSGLDTARECMSFGCVRASMVARLPPMWLPYRHIFAGKADVGVWSIVERMWLSATETSWIGVGYVCGNGEGDKR